MINIQIRNASHHPLPSYATAGSAGADLRAFIPKDITLQPMERKLISTGLYIAVPLGYEAQIRARSGLSIKQGLTLINAVGTIDSDYRGELRIPLVNLSTEPQTIQDGDRIAQLIIAVHELASWQEVEDLTETDRGIGGFGSSGKR